MIPPSSDPRWGVLVDKPESFTYDFLALRILMQRVARKAQESPASRKEAIDEVVSFFNKNEKFLASDIARILG